MSLMCEWSGGVRKMFVIRQILAKTILIQVDDLEELLGALGPLRNQQHVRHEVHDD